MGGGERVYRRRDPRGIEPVVNVGAGLGHEIIHILTRYRTAPMLSREIPGS